MSTLEKTETKPKIHTGSLLLGTGLTLAAMIIIPAIASRLGLSSSLTGALRLATMKASSHAVGDESGGKPSAPPPSAPSCH